MRASSLPLLTKCSGSAYLPQDDTKSENAQDGADWGSMVHLWKETGKIVGRDRRSEKAFARAVADSKINREELWPSDGTHETAIALSIDGNRHSAKVHPSPPVLSWLTGTDDFHWYFLDGDLWIDDLKTGKYYVSSEDGSNLFPQDVRSTQLRFYALGVATLLGYSGNVHVSLTHWPRLPVVRRHALPERFWTSYTTDELMVFWGELEDLYKEVSDGIAGTPTLRPGDHCRFCPSRNYCLEAEPIQPFNWRNK